MSSYLTVQGQSTAEIVEKKSRFIASLSHVETEEQTLAFLESIRGEHRMARHNVYAYVLQKGGRIRYSDDGEPQRTAGLPTLEIIQHEGLSDVVLVTTRYFGGTLLGTGGLVRAYTRAAQAAIETAEKVTISRCVDVLLKLPYPLYDQALKLIEQQGVRVKNTHFTDEVTLELVMLEEFQKELLEQMKALTHGRANLEVGEVYDAVF